LDRSGYSSVYNRQVQDLEKGQMLARNEAPRRSRAGERVRAQSEDDLVLPPPGLLGVPEPSSAGLPPVGSMAMVDHMTDRPVKNVPADSKGWNGGTRFRRISESTASDESGNTLPNARSSRLKKTELAENDLAPISHIDADGEMKDSQEPFAKKADQLADNGERGSQDLPTSRRDSASDAPRVRLLPVQDLDASDSNEAKPWNAHPVR
jgi:hypothetical protein